MINVVCGIVKLIVWWILLVLFFIVLMYFSESIKVVIKYVIRSGLKLYLFLLNVWCLGWKVELEIFINC